MRNLVIKLRFEVGDTEYAVLTTISDEVYRRIVNKVSTTDGYAY